MTRQHPTAPEPPCVECGSSGPDCITTVKGCCSACTATAGRTHGEPVPAAPEGESDANGCDHWGDCAPNAQGCRWVHMEREYDHCDCGGWDERWISRDGGTRIRGRSNHARACANRLPEPTALLADLDAARERVRDVEGERDAAIELGMEACLICKKEASDATARAESAEAALAALRAEVEALADEWDATEFPDEPTATIMRVDLRALLARDEAARWEEWEKS